MSLELFTITFTTYRAGFDKSAGEYLSESD